ncbi:DUF7282 domain-containing protein [Halobellus inordinatus]|uniref:DUF7282 domain-containing protein n=1 Tax=Halobellus inordinatus TaxID=1126236 RepID=UPI002113D345|nr:BGTF surface domain-containing protein [Halobellus ramosii]
MVSKRGFLTFVIICALLVSSTAPAAGNEIQSDEPQFNSGSIDLSALRDGSGIVGDAEDASGTISGDGLTVTRGDETTISVSHSDSATLIIGGEDFGFNTTVRLGGSGTSEVTIDTRTTTAASAGTFIDGGSATLHSEPLDDPIKPAKYPLRLLIDGVERDVRTLSVEAREEMTAEAYRAPRSLTPSEYLGDGTDGNANVGPVEESMIDGETITYRDYAVARFTESGLETALNPDDLSGSATANGLRILVEQTTPHPNQEARTYVATDSDAVTVLPNFAEDEIYVVWDTANTSLSSRTDSNQYRTSVILTDKSAFVDEKTTLATTTFTLREASVSIEPINGSVHQPWDDDTFRVTGQTNRVASTSLEVRLRGKGSNSFLELDDAPVGSDGRFEATLDLTSVPLGTNATLWVWNYRSKTAQRIHLVAPDPEVELPSQTANGTSVLVSQAELPDGGYVRLEDTSGTAVGRSDYLQPGEYENITAELSTPLFESQELRAELIRAGEEQSYNPDAAYYVQEETVINDTAWVEFSDVQTETATPTQTTTSTSTPTATPYPVVTRTPLAPADTSQSSLPLSPVVVIAALAIASIVITRRRTR